MKHLIRRIGGFLTELKRRRVYRALAAYVVFAIAALEVADIVVSRTGLPGWSVNALLYGAMAGFPVIGVMAWVYDITAGGIERTASETPEVREEPRQRKADHPAADLDPHTVAVLPFENLSGAEAAEPLVVGLHDDLLTELSRTSALRVISATSVRAFQRAGRSAPETGVALGAGTVVQGTIQMSGARVRLNIQVVDARSDAYRWAERYDRELSAENIFELQAELATRIRETLRARLTSEEVARQPAQPTGDLEAYRFYVQGRRSLEEWSEASLRRAVEDFTAALERDPGYAAAWSGLADGVSLLDWYGYPPVPEAPGAGDAVARALELDPELAEAHVSDAIVHASPGIRNAPAALESLRRAVELRPSYAYAYAWMGWVHLLLGDPQAGVEAERTATRLDPLSPANHVFLAEAHLAAGNPEAALGEVVRGREIQPDRPLTHLLESIVLHHLGRIPDALDGFDRCLGLVDPSSSAPTRAEVQAFRSVSLAAAGRREDIRRIQADEAVQADPFCRGLVQVASGDVEGALDAFEELDRWGQLSTECLRYFYPAELASLRSSERYPALLEAVRRSWEPGGASAARRGGHPDRGS